MEKIGPEILKTKQHFEILDGLRGVAALAIVTFHFMEVVYSDYSQDFIGHGYLAVDFFFCLSGFVIAYAYDDRIGKMAILDFFHSRLIRLHPLVIFGSVLGVIGFEFDPFSSNPGLYGAGRIALIFLCSTLVIPFPVMPDRFFNLFSFNAPAWSLFWEYVANIFYALILWRISRRYLLIFAIIPIAALCYVAWRSGNLLGGWSGGTFWDGCVRISYSFLAGLLIYRFNWTIKNDLGFIGLSILLAFAFLMPFSKWNWLTEPMVVLLYFPLLISLGAGAVLKPGLKKLCVFSGKISYPLYMTHYAFIWIFAGYYNTHKPARGQLTLIIISSVVLLLGIAWVTMTFYDIPVRRHLSDKRKQSR